METLFNDMETFTKERPLKPTAKQEEAYWITKALEVLDEGWSDSEIDVVVSDLKSLSRCDNGYERAKSLEMWSANGSYEIDMEFVAWLDDIYTDYDQLVEENQKAWVKAHGIEPVFKQGIILRCAKELRGSFRIGDTAFVHGINRETGKYSIGKNLSGGYLIDYEKAHEYFFVKDCPVCGEVMRDANHCLNPDCLTYDGLE